MKWLKGEGPEPLAGGFRDCRQKLSNACRPSSQKTDSNVKMKSAWLSLTPSLLIRTKMSATCSSSTVGAISSAVNGYF